jgi:hypothetical protein
VHPGDQVTFRITYTVPSSDAENLTIQDWLPLPIFDVTDPDGDLIPATFAPLWVGSLQRCDPTSVVVEEQPHRHQVVSVGWALILSQQVVFGL